jgi:hypothetical protein
MHLFHPLFHPFPISDFCIEYHACHVISSCIHIVMEILAYIGFIFNVALFWFITKHKGRVHGLEEMFGFGYLISHSILFHPRLE